jgi:hypothetical protein
MPGFAHLFQKAAGVPEHGAFHPSVQHMQMGAPCHLLMRWPMLRQGMWRFFLYTWPFLPRKSDPKMSFSARLLCTVLCTLVGLMCMMVRPGVLAAWREHRQSFDRASRGFVLTRPTA